MPTYEYACRSCGRHLEVVQSFADDPLTTCPDCSGELRRVFHPVGVMFKGSGFYSTDAKGKSAKARSSDGSKSDQSTKQSTDTKSEVKAESKPASNEKSKESS